MTPTVAIALSGGIDSLVSAALLKEQGYRVIGLHFLHGYENGDLHGGDPRDAQAFAAMAARARRKLDPLADQLDIPVHLVDLRQPFQERVVDYFIRTYQNGCTPNPCLVCNPSIKFDLLVQKARALGAERLATGHYARIVEAPDGRRRLMRGIDTAKDQSYFLARLTQPQLAGALLPLGAVTKEQTRRIAGRKALIPSSALESQDVCFITNGDYHEFIRRQPGFESVPGPIEDLQGRTVGRHSGLHRYTIGQRRGINCPAAHPYYVIRLEPQRNCVVVGTRQDLAATRCRVTDINWIDVPPRRPFVSAVQVRYRHKAVPALVTPFADNTAQVDFHAPESALTPGQGAVFYLKDEVLGGGWIA